MKPIEEENMRQIAQGDLLITRIDDIPAGAEEMPATEGVHVLAHSETGHHHACGDREPGEWTVQSLSRALRELQAACGIVEGER